MSILFLCIFVRKSRYFVKKKLLGFYFFSENGPKKIKQDQCPVHQQENLHKSNCDGLFSIFILGEDTAEHLLNEINHLLELRRHQMLIKNKWVTLPGAGVGQMIALLSEECQILHQQERSLFVAVRPVFTDCDHCWQECKDKG